MFELMDGKGKIGIIVPFFFPIDFGIEFIFAISIFNFCFQYKL